MDRNALRYQIRATRDSLLEEDIIDEHFLEIERMETEDDPEFVHDVMTIFVTEVPLHLASIDQLMKAAPNFERLGNCFSLLKACSLTVGAKQLKIEVEKGMTYCEEHNLQGAMDSIELLKQEFEVFKAKLDPYFQLKKQMLDMDQAEESRNPKK